MSVLYTFRLEFSPLYPAFHIDKIELTIAITDEILIATLSDRGRSLVACINAHDVEAETAIEKTLRWKAAKDLCLIKILRGLHTLMMLTTSIT